jgi:hypothetical protein
MGSERGPEAYERQASNGHSAMAPWRLSGATLARPNRWQSRQVEQPFHAAQDLLSRLPGGACPKSRQQRFRLVEEWRGLRLCRPHQADFCDLFVTQRQQRPRVAGGAAGSAAAIRAASICRKLSPPSARRAAPHRSRLEKQAQLTYQGSNRKTRNAKPRDDEHESDLARPSHRRE